MPGVEVIAGFAAFAVSRVGFVPMKVDHLEECDG